MTLVIINIVLLCFVLMTAIVATRTNNLVSAVFSLAAFSFLLATLWSLLAAPDVSFTEAVIGVGASTIFFLLALFNTNHVIEPQTPQASQNIGWIVVALLSILFVWASFDMPLFGSLNSPANAYLSTFYLQNTLADCHTPNAVTAVVVDYRGFDTLIESTVIFTAGAACLLIMRTKS